MLEQVWMVHPQHRASEGGTSTPRTGETQEIQNDFNQDYQGVAVIIDIITIKMEKLLSLLEKKWFPNKFKYIFLQRTNIISPSICYFARSNTTN